MPSLVLFPLTIWKSRQWTWLSAATSLCVAGPLMGFCWSVRPAAEGQPLRVMTYNVELWNKLALVEIAREIREHNPDILCLQDARGALVSNLESVLSEWNVAVQDQYVIASRFPFIRAAAAAPRSTRGQPHFIVRVAVHGRPVTVVNAHFITPRVALTAVGREQFQTRGIRIIARNVSRRLNEAASLADSVRDVQGPLIILGDLNAPPPSLVSRRLREVGLTDAFAASGRGYGYTYGHDELFGHSFVRIDRIFLSQHFVPARTLVGGTTGSDHRPVIADLVLLADQ